MKHERKSLLLADFRPEIKAEGDGSGSITGHASTFGNIDSYGDTIQPGAYAAGLSDFLRDGFLAWQHDWNLDIGYPTEAREDTVGLYISAAFYPDPDAQQRRDRTVSRLTAGKSVGLSIGYIPTKFSFREEDNRIIRVLEEIKLYEVSIVMVPADKFAGVDEAKTEEEHSSTFADHAKRVLLSVTSLHQRAQAISELRAKEGRVLSTANVAALDGIAGELETLAGQVRQLLDTAKPQKESDARAATDTLRLRTEYQRTLTRVRALGVAV